MTTANITLEGLVCQNKMPEAIEHLKSLLEDLGKEPYTNLLAVSARLQANKRNSTDGTAEYAMTEMESNRIRAAFLSILSGVREEIQAKINFFKPIPRS